MKKFISLGTVSMATNDQVVCSLAIDKTGGAGVACGPLNNRALCLLAVAKKRAILVAGRVLP